ncbi:hypothetical protein BLOT_010872 [Blomia tropicalis]|nr:hypothetical protein BLOT_010872 [Blomia tropicalis]
MVSSINRFGNESSVVKSPIICNAFTPLETSAILFATLSSSNKIVLLQLNFKFWRIHESTIITDHK